MRKQLTRVQLMENWEANWQRERRLKEERMREQTETEGADAMSEELYPLGHEADETMYSAGELRQLLNDERARSYARGYRAGVKQAAGVCDADAEKWKEKHEAAGQDQTGDYWMEAEHLAAAIRRLASPKETG